MARAASGVIALADREDVVIFGTGGLSRTVACYLKAHARFNVVAFTVDADFMDDSTIDGVPVIPFEQLEHQVSAASTSALVVLTLQRTEDRFLDKRKCRELVDKGFALATFVSPSAVLPENVVVGKNVIISPGVIIEPFCSIGDGVIIRSGAYIGHDVELGDFSYIAPRASLSGNVRVGAHAFVGNNATVRGGVCIGSGAVVGAGTTILRDVVVEAVVKAPENILLPISRDRLRLN